MIECCLPSRLKAETAAIAPPFSFLLHSACLPPYDFVASPRIWAKLGYH